MRDMRQIQAQNHPKKGSTITVEPFTKKKDIQLVKKYLTDKPLDLALFVIGINTNLRASDILQIKVSQVKDLNPMDEILIKEKKTAHRKKAPRRINLNNACIDAIQNLLNSKQGLKLIDDDYLFTGKRGTVIGTPAVNLKVKRWARACNIKGNFGSHSLRKSFGYHKRKAGVDIPTLMVLFNHSTQKQTLDYLCVQRDELKNVYRCEL